MNKKTLMLSLLLVLTLSSCANNGQDLQKAMPSSDEQEKDLVMDYKTWTGVCLEETIDTELIGCMENIAEKLDIILGELTNSKVAMLYEENRNAYQLKVTEQEKQIKINCWKELQQYGLGRLNNRRLPLCVNDGRIKLILAVLSGSILDK